MRTLLALCFICLLSSGCVMTVKEYAQINQVPPTTQPASAAVAQDQGSFWLPPFYISRPTEYGGRSRDILWPLINQTKDERSESLTVLPFYKSVSLRLPNQTETKVLWTPVYVKIRAFEPVEGSAKTANHVRGLFPLYLRQTHPLGEVHTALLFFQFGSAGDKNFVRLVPFPEIKY